MKSRISMITLGVSNLNRSVEFYQRGLGLRRFEFEGDRVAFFDLSGTWLGLFGAEDLAKDANVPYRPGEFNRVSLAHNLTSKEEVDAQMNEARKAGATITKEAEDTFWGGYSGYFADPDGHLWEVAYNPFMFIGPHDS